METGSIKSHKVGSIPTYVIKEEHDGSYHIHVGNAYTPYGIVEFNQYWEDDASDFNQMMMEMILEWRRFRAKVSGHHSPRQITKHAKEFARQCYLLSYPAEDQKKEDQV